MQYKSSNFAEFAKEFEFKAEQPLAGLSWLRTGGNADWFFQPKDAEQLSAFLKACPLDVPLFPMGVGSNTIFRDGGVEGVVIRLGRAFMDFDFLGQGRVQVGAAMLDAMLARKAAVAGIDLTFLRTIPGAIGGAIAMNAGCYGSYISDITEEIHILTRDGDYQTLRGQDVKFDYRYTHLPEGCVILGAIFQGGEGEPAHLNAQMEDALAKREASQPTKERSCGSTFRNPIGHSSTGADGEDHTLKAWKVIDDAGLRGATLGEAQMSEMHPNFLINMGNATAYDLEALGEHVRATVQKQSAIELTWEIKRVGRFASEQTPNWKIS